MRRAVVRRMELPKDRRVLAISDIHGNLPFLKGVLEKAGFCREDLLFLVGDIIEKGPANLETLRYVMELTKGGNVFPIAGNCDGTALSLVEGSWEREDFFNFLICRPRWLLHEMGAEYGFRLRKPEDMEKLRELVIERFPEELAFLAALPTIIDTPGFLFVHGGVPSSRGLEELSAWSCMKNDDFLSKETYLDKWCVVGHWPVTLYRPQIPSADPLVRRDKRVVSIDGGCCLKWDGQLNALILPSEPEGEFSWVRYDGLPTVTALERQEESRESVNIRYGHSALEILEEGREFCRCRHVETGRVLDVLTEYLYRRPDGVFCEDSTDYRLGVEPGDALSVVRRTSRGILAKKDGTTGWYLGPVA